MKTLPVVAILVICFLLSSLQRDNAPSPPKPTSQVAASKQKTDSGKTKPGAAAPLPTPLDAADQNATNASGPRENDKVEVTAVPPEITVKQVKDSFDRTILCCTIVLTIVGVVGMGVGVWTLLAIKDQAETLHEHSAELRKLAEAARENAGGAKENAEAARLNAQALINAERPWLMVHIKEIPGENVAKTHFQLYAFNYGSSPAHVIACNGPSVTWCDEPDKELSVPPDYGVWEWDTRFLAPKDSFPMRDAIEPWSERINFVTPRATQGIPTPGKSQLVIYGLLEYRDGVTDTIHRTAFCYRRKRDNFSEMGGHLVPCGPPIYNEYT